MADFSNILNKRPGEFKRPKPVPVGTYMAVVNGRYETGESSGKKTPYIDIPIKLLSAGADVDPAAAAEYEGLIGKEIKGRGGLRFYITEESGYRLEDFLRDTLKIEEGERPLDVRLAETMGKQFYVSFRHNPSQDGKDLYQEVSGTAAL